jgi:hypothetical protein
MVKNINKPKQANPNGVQPVLVIHSIVMENSAGRGYTDSDSFISTYGQGKEK